MSCQIGKEKVNTFFNKKDIIFILCIFVFFLLSFGLINGLIYFIKSIIIAIIIVATVLVCLLLLTGMFSVWEIALKNIRKPKNDAG